MRRPILITRLLITVATTVFGSSLALNAHADERSSVKKSAWKVLRALGGQPDLQDNWTNATLTPLERATQLGTRLNLTEAEAARIEGSAARHVEDNAQPTDPKLGIQDLPKDCGYGFTGTNCWFQTLSWG